MSTRPASIVAVAVAVLALSACTGDNAHIVAPTSLAASPRATSLTLTWIDRSAGETGFAIERDDGDGRGDLHEIARLPANISRFEDRGLSPVTSYRYRVVTILGTLRVGSEIVPLTTVSPSVQAVTPDSDFGSGGSIVTLHGDGFSAGVEAVSFGLEPAAGLSVRDDATMTCVVPPSPAPAVVAIELQTPSGTTSHPELFAYYEWPPAFGGEQMIEVGTTAVPTGAQFETVDGYLYALWGYDRESVWFARSTDAGRQWDTTIRLDSGQGEPRHPRLAAAGRGVFVVWEDRLLLTLNRSANHGASWRGEAALDHPGSPADSPNVHAAGTTVHLTWSDLRPGYGQLYYDRSTDSGATWQPQPTRLNPGSQDAQHVQIASAGDRIYLLWWSQGEAIYCNSSPDGGVTWLDREVSLGLRPRRDDAAPPRLRCAGERVYVVCEEKTNIAFVRSTDAGERWSQPQILDSYLGYSYRPEIAIAGDNVYVVWYDGELFQSPGVSANRSIDGGVTWLRRAPLLRHAISATPIAPALACAGERLFVAWSATDPTGAASVYLGESNDAGQTWPGQGPLRGARRLSTTAGAELPLLTSYGARVVVLWRQYEPVMQRYGFRAVTNARF